MIGAGLAYGASCGSQRRPARRSTSSADARHRSTCCNGLARQRRQLADDPAGPLRGRSSSWLSSRRRVALVARGGTVVSVVVGGMYRPVPPDQLSARDPVYGRFGCTCYSIAASTRGTCSASTSVHGWDLTEYLRPTARGVTLDQGLAALRAVAGRSLGAAGRGPRGALAPCRRGPRRRRPGRRRGARPVHARLPRPPCRGRQRRPDDRQRTAVPRRRPAVRPVALDAGGPRHRLRPPPLGDDDPGRLFAASSACPP